MIIPNNSQMSDYSIEDVVRALDAAGFVRRDSEVNIDAEIEYSNRERENIYGVLFRIFPRQETRITRIVCQWFGSGSYGVLEQFKRRDVVVVEYP